MGAEDQQILAAISALDGRWPEHLVDATRALELANKAYSLYLRQKPAEQAKLLRIVISNCSVDAVNIYPTYRKPFDLIVRRAKNEEWYALADDFRTCEIPVSSEIAAFSAQIS